MKGGIFVIYTSLVTISVVLSSVSFLLVVSEALKEKPDIDQPVDLSGLRNISKHLSKLSSEVPRPVPTKVDHGDTVDNGNLKEETTSEISDKEIKFPDTLTLNSVTTDGLPDTGQPPILISLADTAKLELKNREDLLHTNKSEQHNDTQTFTIVDDTDNKETEKEVQETLVVQAIPMHEVRLQKETSQTGETVEKDVTESQPESLANTITEEIPVQPATPQEDIPSFSEWTQKQLAQAEKQDTVLNHSTHTSQNSSNVSSKSTKLRSKNYASPVCGAKIVAVNPEAGSASSILSPNKDEYMLNTCNSRIWFVVELCEPVQAQKIELANFELFSSTPKDIAVYFSDRFPTREWASVGQFTAEDLRDVQSFDLFPHLFGKFIKVELLSHHGSEHYCPISLFKVFGTSEFEVLEKESSHASHVEDEEDEIIDVPDLPSPETESKNLFGSARDAVMSIMKKAAEVLAKSEVPKNATSAQNDTAKYEKYKGCCTPSHLIVCDNCSETLYNEVYELIACRSDKLTNLLRQVFMKDTLKCTNICQPFGLDFKSTKTIEFSEERTSYVKALFPSKYLAALCNLLAIKEKKVVLNTSFESEHNATNNITGDDNLDTNNGNNNPDPSVKLVLPNDNTSSDVGKPSKDAEIEKPTIIVDSVTESNIFKESKKEEKIEDIIPIAEPYPAEPVDQEAKTEVPISNNDQAKSDADTKDPVAPKTDSKNGKFDTTPEKSKEMGNNLNGDDVNDQLLVESDSFLSDFDQLTVDPTPTGVQSTQSQNPGQSLQKESVFLRLCNRVKALERNMSLSGQYLEELSRRYKKQVEEMQKSFEKTILQMTEERKKSNEREQKYYEQMSQLQTQMGQMAAAVALLMDERDSWFGNLTFFKFVVFQTIIIATAIYFLSKKPKRQAVIAPIPKKLKKKDKFRRKSVEGVSGHATPAAKKRRPSEEALQIARLSAEELSKEDDDGEWIIAKKGRRRKTSILHRNLEAIESGQVWSRQDSLGKLQENTIPLDDDEYLSPLASCTQFNENIDPSLVTKKGNKPNGSIFSSFKNKTIKTRRLSSPAFLRTFSKSSSRSTPSPSVVSEVLHNGTPRALSDSPATSLCSESTELSQLNGFDSDKNRSKKKKGLKNLFKILK